MKGILNLDRVGRLWEKGFFRGCALPIFSAKKKIKSLPPKHGSLTIEKLRELTLGLEISDEEAEEVVDSIRLFVKVLYAAAMKGELTADEKSKSSLDN